MVADSETANLLESKAEEILDDLNKVLKKHGINSIIAEFAVEYDGETFAEKDLSIREQKCKWGCWKVGERWVCGIRCGGGK